MEESGKWNLEMSLLIILSMSLSGILFLVQEKFGFPPTIHNILRTIRMLLIYGVLPILFSLRHRVPICKLGICLPKSKTKLLISVLGGVSIYQFAAMVFISFRIFFYGWTLLSKEEVFVNLILVGIMASLTDFWTRGFILLQISERFGKMWGIIIQNLTWFMIHLYEIQLLQYYIGWAMAIGLTLFLGILGDLVALKTKNLYGLMLGHFFLNLQIALVARGNLVIYPVLI